MMGRHHRAIHSREVVSTERGGESHVRAVYCGLPGFLVAPAAENSSTCRHRLAQEVRNQEVRKLLS